MAKIEQKKVIVDEIRSRLEKASSAVLVTSQGLTVEEDTKLRKQLREAGVDYKVYKNTMVNFAVEGTEYEKLKPYLEGPNALAICYEDPAAAASIIDKFRKNSEIVKFKAGIIEGTFYDEEGMDTIAKIPSRSELLSKLLGSFKSPMASFARLINAVAEKQAETTEA